MASEDPRDNTTYQTAKLLYSLCKRYFCSTYVEGQPCFGQKRAGIKEDTGDKPLPCDKCEIGKYRQYACNIMKPYDDAYHQQEVEFGVCKFALISSEGKKQGEPCWLKCSKTGKPCDKVDMNGVVKGINEMLAGKGKNFSLDCPHAKE